MSAGGPDERRARVVLLLGSIGVVIGIGLSGSMARMQFVGGAALVVGWLTLVVGIHRFGRLGTR